MNNIANLDDYRQVEKAELSGADIFNLKDQIGSHGGMASERVPNIVSFNDRFKANIPELSYADISGLISAIYTLHRIHKKATRINEIRAKVLDPCEKSQAVEKLLHASGCALYQAIVKASELYEGSEGEAGDEPTP
jgi:hypothetical protein